MKAPTRRFVRAGARRLDPRPFGLRPDRSRAGGGLGSPRLALRANHRRALATLATGLALLLAPGRLLGQDRVPGDKTDPASSRQLAPFTVPPEVRGVTYLKVIAFGDWGSGRPDQAYIASGMATHAREHGLDLMITTGDNFYPIGVASVDDPQWASSFERMYAAPALQVPVWPSLGNHDHLGSVQAQLDYGKTHPRWRLPAAYHTFSQPLGPGASVDFFVIDTSTLRSRDGDPRQLAWFTEALNASTARWKVVVGHHPFYSNGTHGNDRGLRDRLEPIFVAGKVDLYLCGHDHTLELRRPVQGVVHLVTGGAGGRDWSYPVTWTDEDLYSATGGGFSALRFSKDELVIELVRGTGLTQWAWTMTKARLGPY